MKENVLKPHTGKKERYALRAFLWGILIAALFIVPCMIIDGGRYIYYGDYNYQVVPFYQNMVSSIHSGNVSWSWNADLGSSFVGAYSFYNLGSPFFLLLLLFPAKAVSYLMGPLTILKFGVSSWSAYLFLRRYTKNKNNAVIGAMLYAFSGAAVYNMVFHFIDSMAIFPLLLAALDDYIYDNKKGRFALVTALCAVTNYYLFAAEAVFCLVYWIVRMATGSFKIDSRRVLYLIFEAIIGTGIAMALLLPNIYYIAGSSRASGADFNGTNMWVFENGYIYLTTLVSFFMPPENAQSEVYVPMYEHAWSSITAYLPLFGMAGVFAVIFNKHRNKWMRVFYGVCAVMMCVPVFNSSFQFFSDSHYMRWFFMLLLVMALGSVMALEDPSTKWKKAIVTNLVITSIIILIIGLTPYKPTFEGVTLGTRIGIYNDPKLFWFYSSVALINIVLCASFIVLYKKNKDAFKRYGSVIVSAAIVLTLGSTFIPEKVITEKYCDPDKNGMFASVEDAGIADIDLWRSDVLTASTYSKDMYDKDSAATEDIAALQQADLEYVNTAAAGTNEKKNVLENAASFWNIPSFGSFHSMVESSLGDFYYGIGYERASCSDLPIGMYGYRSILGTKYLFARSDSALKVNGSDGSCALPGWNYLKTWNGYDIYENEYAAPIGTSYKKFMTTIDFDKIPQQYKHLVLCDTIVTDSVNQMFSFAEAGYTQVFADDYDFTQEEYFKNCSDRIENGVYDFKRDNKGFEAKFTAGSNDDYVLFSVPFDQGWTATVNGEKAVVEKADYGFMLVKVPANQESVIRFDYHTPGTLYGTFVTVICALIFVVYLAVMKMRDAGEADETTEKPDEKKSDSKSDSTDKKDKTEAAKDEKTESSDEELEDMSIFDIVKQTEEQTMMHVYKRVPVVLERGFGAVGYDIENNKYIDFTSGIGVNALGYSDGRWAEAVEKQVYSVQHTSNLYYNTTQIQLAEMLCMKTGFSKVFFANSGAEANECAIKIARKYGSDRFGEKHTHIITLENSFHGRTITTLSATGQDVFHKFFTPFTEGFTFAKANDMDSIRECTTEDTCAVMIELIQGEGGVNPLDKKFVTELAAYCKEKDLLLIVDEIQTGVGRTGRLYCYENFGIEPDVVTSAKALSGGLPLSACMCNERLKDVLGPGSNGTTFGGNPIACAGGLKILEIVGEEKFLADVRAKGEYMRERIKNMKGVKEVRGLGMMIGIVLEKNNAGEVLGKCAENGLLVLTAKSLIRLLPPLNIEYEDIDEGLEILERCILETLSD